VGAKASTRRPNAAWESLPSPEERMGQAIELMMSFADRTGLTGGRPQRRYLWTDAFAVRNFLGLGRATRDERHTELGLELVDCVHGVLGRHRSDDPRTGFISGLDADEATSHPTRGGLRIGKELPERRPGERLDARLEWDRDGQYFHYLTQWMHALDQSARARRSPIFAAWARELAETAFRAFTYVIPGTSRRSMYWKMSIDLSRPLVRSMGQHDALEGHVACLELQATGSELGRPAGTGPLLEEAAGFLSMIETHGLATADPLGIGGLLVAACRLAQLEHEGFVRPGPLVEALLGAALEGLVEYADRHELRLDALERLAFRELGLSIGLHAVALMEQLAGDTPDRSRFSEEARAHLSSLARYAPLGRSIEAFWMDPEHRRTPTWVEHRDIDEVMLSTSLVPEGFLLRIPVK